MSESVTLQPVSGDQWRVVERLWQLYRHDLSEFRHSMYPGADGLYRAGQLPNFYPDHPNQRGYLIYAGDVLAGFALISGLETQPRTVAEFFVIRPLRRQGVGHAAALALLRGHPGDWTIAFQEENPGAARFWRGIVTEVVGTQWSQESRPVPNKPEIPPDTWLTFIV